MALQALLGLHLLVQLLLQAAPLVLQLAQLGGHVELLPGFLLKQLLQKGHAEVQGPTPGGPYPRRLQMTWPDTHLGVLELGPEGRHVLGQFDGLALRLVEHPRDTLHFILWVPRGWLVGSSRTGSSLSKRGSLYSVIGLGVSTH